MSISVEVLEKYCLYNVRFELCVIRTNLIKDFSIMAFSDFQECESTNNIIFDFAFSRFNDLGYKEQCDDAISICCGDMYGESYYENDKRIEIRGSDGVPNYSLYNRTKLFYYVYGNHDLLSSETGANMKCLGDLKQPIGIKNQHTIIGVNGIKSAKTINSSHDSDYETTTRTKLINKPTILVTHETPLINDGKMNPRKIGNKALMDLVLQHKPQIHFFGHCHFDEPCCYINKTLFVNVDSRFVLLVPFE